MTTPAENNPVNGKLIGTSVLARSICDTGSQLFNPFLPIIAAGMQTSVITVGQLVGVRSITGLLAPVFGAIADRYGFQRVMQFGLLAAAAGTCLVGSSTSLIQAVCGMFIWGVGVTAFVPCLQAYLGTQLPYERRARGIGMVEYAWALAGIIGLFSMGWLIRSAGWRSPFFVLSFGLLVMSFAVARFPSYRKPVKKHSADSQKARTTRSQKVIAFFQLGTQAKSAYAAMLGTALFFWAAMQLFIAHGDWLKNEYHIGPASLGTVALVLGFSDLCGSGLVSWIADRLGKYRCVLLGSLAALIGYLLLPVLNVDLVWAVLSIAIARSGFEFAIVSNIALLSEQVPQQRGKVMTLTAAVMCLGSTIASLSGPWLYSVAGVRGLSISSASLTLIAILIFLLFVRERQPSSD